MLPTTAEVIDNPIGTACGFALDIGRARFFFTPGVPRELRRMLEEQVIPRILAKSGVQAVIHLKRFHSYGLGESHVDALLAGVEEMVADGSVKLGFRAHYPQLETKLTMRGADRTTSAGSSRRSRAMCAIASATSSSGGRQDLEGVVLAELASAGTWPSPRRSRADRSRRASAPCQGRKGVPARRGVARGERALRGRGAHGRAPRG